MFFFLFKANHHHLVLQGETCLYLSTADVISDTRTHLYDAFDIEGPAFEAQDSASTSSTKHWQIIQVFFNSRVSQVERNQVFPNYFYSAFSTTFIVKYSLPRVPFLFSSFGLIFCWLSIAWHAANRNVVLLRRPSVISVSSLWTYNSYIRLAPTKLLHTFPSWGQMFMNEKFPIHSSIN